MRVLRVIPSLDPRGGGPVECGRQFDQELSHRGWHVEVATLDAPEAGDFLNTYPAEVHALGPAKLGYRYTSKLSPWLKANRTRFDCIIVDGIWQYHSLGVWRALAETNTPYIVFTHGMLSPWFKQSHPLKHLKKWLYWPWGDYRVLRDARQVVFTCEEERIQAKKSFWLYKAKEAVVPLGTIVPDESHRNSHAEAFLAKFPACKEKKIVLFLGRIHPIKGCDLLIQAFAKIAITQPDLILLIAGPDPDGWSNELKQQALILGISKQIIWTGMLSGNEKWGAFKAATIFCLPSHHENFGVVVAEALSCSTPVLISNKVNIWREVQEDGAGLVNDDSVVGTSAGLTTWLSMTPEQQTDMRVAARNCFERRFRIEHATERLMCVISEHGGKA